MCVGATNQTRTRGTVSNQRTNRNQRHKMVCVQWKYACRKLRALPLPSCAPPCARVCARACVAPHRHTATNTTTTHHWGKGSTHQQTTPPVHHTFHQSPTTTYKVPINLFTNTTINNNTKNNKQLSNQPEETGINNCSPARMGVVVGVWGWRAAWGNVVGARGGRGM